MGKCSISIPPVLSGIVSRQNKMVAFGVAENTKRLYAHNVQLIHATANTAPWRTKVDELPTRSFRVAIMKLYEGITHDDKLSIDTC